MTEAQDSIRARLEELAEQLGDYIQKHHGVDGQLLADAGNTMLQASKILAAEHEAREAAEARLTAAEAALRETETWLRSFREPMWAPTDSEIELVADAHKMADRLRAALASTPETEQKETR